MDDKNRPDRAPATGDDLDGKPHRAGAREKPSHPTCDSSLHRIATITDGYIDLYA